MSEIHKCSAPALLGTGFIIKTIKRQQQQIFIDRKYQTLLICGIRLNNRFHILIHIACGISVSFTIFVLNDPTKILQIIIFLPDF